MTIGGHLTWLLVAKVLVSAGAWAWTFVLGGFTALLVHERNPEWIRGALFTSLFATIAAFLMHVMWEA